MTFFKIGENGFDGAFLGYCRFKREAGGKRGNFFRGFFNQKTFVLLPLAFRALFFELD